MVVELKNNNHNKVDDGQESEQTMDFTDRAEIDEKETVENDGVKYIRLEYEKVTKKPNQYLLINDNIWRLHQLRNQDILYQQVEVIRTKVDSYICSIEWDYNEEKQSKMSDNPCWDEKNQKRKEIFNSSCNAIYN